MRGSEHQQESGLTATGARLSAWPAAHRLSGSGSDWHSTRNDGKL